MIVGEFRDRFPRISLELPGLAGPLRVEFIVDTGFDGALTLPEAILRQLGARPFAVQTHLLADGSEIDAYAYRIAASWDGHARDVEVLVFENNPLLGTLLLEGCQLNIEAIEDGEVIIEAIV